MTKPFVMKTEFGAEIKEPYFITGIKFSQGKHMTLDTFRTHVKEGNINDGDGPAFLATETTESDVVVYASDMEDGNIFPEWATHVVWYSE